MSSIVTVEMTSFGKVEEFTGTVEELLRNYQVAHILKCGKRDEREAGNKRVNLTPRTGKGLVTALNNAVTNADGHNGHTTFTLKK